MATQFVKTREKERSNLTAAPNPQNNAQDRTPLKQTLNSPANAAVKLNAFNQEGENVYSREKLHLPLANYNLPSSKPELDTTVGQSRNRDILLRSNPRTLRKSTLSQTESIADTTAISNDDLHDDQSLYHRQQQMQVTDDNLDALNNEKLYQVLEEQPYEELADYFVEQYPDWQGDVDSQKIHMHHAGQLRSLPAGHCQENEFLPNETERYQHCRAPTTNSPADLNRPTRCGNVAPPVAKPTRASKNSFDEEDFIMSTRAVAAKAGETRSRIATTLKTSSNVSSDDNEPTCKSMTSSTTPQMPRSKLKRPLPDNDLDYDVATLKSMSFAILDDEPFTKDPRRAHAAPMSLEPSSNTQSILSQKLSNISTMSQGDVKTLFRHQTDADREETGKWFVCQLSTFMSELQDNCIQRREVSMRFEDEVKRRLAAVEIKGTHVQAEMDKLKTGGQQLIGDKNRGANERATSVGSATTATTAADDGPGGHD